MNPTKRPTRETAGGRAYIDLQALAKERGRPVDEYLTLYALEGFLNRLSRSPRRDNFVLKGGVLLAAFDERRPTRDVDLGALHLDNDVDGILDVLREVAATELDDGLEIDIDNATAETIRDNSAGYTGARVTFPTTLESARVTFHVDVNVGDPISPDPTLTSVPRLLGGTIDVLGYPVEMVIAEKLVTAVERGAVNTRWRDFVDMHRLANSRPMSGAVLVESCATVASYRGATLIPLGEALTDFAEIAQTRWSPWRRKQRLEAQGPDRIADLIAGLVVFADPILDGTAAQLSWDPARREWV